MQKPILLLITSTNMREKNEYSNFSQSSARNFDCYLISKFKEQKQKLNALNNIIDFVNVDCRKNPIY